MIKMDAREKGLLLSKRKEARKKRKYCLKKMIKGGPVGEVSSPGRIFEPLPP